MNIEAKDQTAFWLRVELQLFLLFFFFQLRNKSQNTKCNMITYLPWLIWSLSLKIANSKQAAARFAQNRRAKQAAACFNRRPRVTTGGRAFDPPVLRQTGGRAFQIRGHEFCICLQTGGKTSGRVLKQAAACYNKRPPFWPARLTRERQKWRPLILSPNRRAKQAAAHYNARPRVTTRGRAFYPPV